MIRRYGFGLMVFGAMIVMAAGSARAGIVGHISAVPIGPALNRGPVDGPFGKIDFRETGKEGEGSSGYQEREPVETGNLPESVQPRSDDSRKLQNGENPDRGNIDAGP